MEDLIKQSVFKGVVFSTIQKIGPQPLFMFSEENQFSILDFTRISIKSLSLLIDDKILTEKEKYTNVSEFAIIPFADYKLMGIAYFHFIKKIGKESLVPSTLTLFLEEKNRNFLYNNTHRLKPLILSFIKKLDAKLTEGHTNEENILPFFKKFFMNLLEIEKTPIIKILSPKKLKILLAGLDNSGKTSFLLAMGRKFSELIKIKPTRGANITTLDNFGGTIIFLWDLGGQRVLREGYLKKPHIYLYETDLLFYFIDIQDRSRIEESILYFKEILRKFSEEFTEMPPIIFIFSKGDEDILNTKEIQETIQIIKSKLINECRWKEPIEFYITSIFSIFSILRAFSSGIAKLNPHRELIQHEIRELSMKCKTIISLLLNKEGLVLGDYYSHDSQKILTPNDYQNKILDQELKNILEFTAPQFAIIWKIFSKFKTLKKSEALFNIANFHVLIKGLSINSTQLFLLFLMDDENKRELIDKNLPEFLEKTKEILSTYLS